MKYLSLKSLEIISPESNQNKKQNKLQSNTKDRRLKQKLCVYFFVLKNNFYIIFLHLVKSNSHRLRRRLRIIHLQVRLREIKRRY